MDYNYSFEKSDVWQRSRKVVQQSYRCTEAFPTEEKYGLTSQLRRSAVSVSSNIAEGSTRWSKKDKARFYEMAYGSLIEVLNHLIISTDLEYLTEDDLSKLRPEIDKVVRMLDGLYKSTNN